MSSLQDAWNNFQGGVRSALNQWTALRLAVENNWGGGDSERKAALLEEELLTMFRTKKDIYKDEIVFCGKVPCMHIKDIYVDGTCPIKGVFELMEFRNPGWQVENFLADFLDDNFSTYAEDNSPAEVGALLVEMFAQCGRLDYTLANAVRGEEERHLAQKAATTGGGARSPAVSSSMSVKGEGGESDSSSSEDEEAEDDPMEEEDGWETVGGKKGGKGRRR